MPEISDGLIIVAKRDCPTCVLLEPVYGELAQSGAALAVYSQDDPSFPGTIAGVIDDTSREASYRLDIETVPTLIRMSGGKEVARIVGDSHLVQLAGQVADPRLLGEVVPLGRVAVVGSAHN